MKFLTELEAVKDMCQVLEKHMDLHDLVTAACSTICVMTFTGECSRYMRRRGMLFNISHLTYQILVIQYIDTCWDSKGGGLGSSGWDSRKGEGREQSGRRD